MGGKSPLIQNHQTVLTSQGSNGEGKRTGDEQEAIQSHVTSCSFTS